MSVPSKWTQVSPGRRKTENRLRFGPVSWESLGVGSEVERVGVGEGRGLGGQKELLARLSFEIGDLLLSPFEALNLHTLCFLLSINKYCLRFLS